MPLRRYELRNEYGLADPELYRAADKDDPEALLEGVAMAGLVGVLRQLGDLAEFAAEVFHDLHEEVMVTAARGHGLMARVQQLEAEFPSIEKAFLSQTDHSLFFTNSGVDWHPNLHMDQNLITRGDLPRFVMDSYEECRGPPRLFLLDKFDVAGAGACLKRYTDPSIFKVESPSSGILEGDVQREKKIRKVKKKGTRWRNGETTPEVPTLHAKLHQLFLEECVENGHSDPARLVKLKRRQLNGSPFDLKPGKSYMEKFLETPSPEHKVVCEVSVNSQLLKLTLDDSCESGIEIVEIGTVSPAKGSSPGRESMHLYPIGQGVVLKPCTHEWDKEIANREIVKVPDSIADDEAYESPYISKMAMEDELAVDKDDKTVGSLDGDHSDELMSEIDNYMDALTTMESEMETDNEYKPKNNQGFLRIGKLGTDYDSNEDHMDEQANFSDSQSFGNSSMSDDGKNSFKQERSSISYSDSLSNLAENTPSDMEGSIKIFPSENSTTMIVNSPLHPRSVHVETVATQSDQLIVFNDKCIEEDTVPNDGNSSRNSFLSDSNLPLPSSVPAANSIIVSLANAKLDEIPSDLIRFDAESPKIDQNETNLPDSSTAVSDVPSQTMLSNILATSSKGHLVDELNHEGPNMFHHTSNISVLEQENFDGSANELFKKDYANEVRCESSVKGKVASPPSVVSLSEKQFPCTVLPDINVDSGVTLVSDSLDFIKPAHLDSNINGLIAATGVNSENLMGMAETPEVDSIKEYQCSDISVDVSPVDHNLAGVTFSEENMMRFKEISGPDDGDEIGEVASEVDVRRGNSVLSEHPAKHSDNGLGEDLNLAEDEGAASVTSVVATSANDGDLSLDLVCSPSNELVDAEESHSENEGPHQKGLDFNEVVSECFTESEKEKEVKQVEVAPTDVVSCPLESVSVAHSDLEVLEHVCESGLTDQTHNCSYVGDASTAPSLELLGQELESKYSYSKPSVEPHEDDVCSPTCYLSDARTSVEYSVESHCDQNFVESEHAVMNEANSASLNLQNSPACQLEEPGVPSEQSLELQSDRLDTEPLQADKASSKSLYLQSEQTHTVSDIGQDKCFDTSSEQDAMQSQELVMQSAGQEPNGDMLSRNPFDSVFPSFGVLSENQEEMPPLPPLPPLQWRIPAPLASQREWIGHGEEKFLSMQPCKADEKSQPNFPSPGRGNMQPSSPFLSVTSADIQWSQHLNAESVDNPLQPTPVLLEVPAVVCDANSNQGYHPSGGTQSLNPFLTLPEITSEKSEDDLFLSGGRLIGSGPNPLPAAATVEHTPIENDPVPSDGLQINPSNQVIHEPSLKATVPEDSLQTSGEESSSHEKSASPTVLKDQPQHDSVTLQGETWLLSTLALPPTYEVGKANGSKLPRPRNPLIDAVAAHDKSKLRKVTERVRPQIGPNLDERNSLLEQIRTKSFNLKPTAVTRPSIQGIQGPKTNLRVAAILEKANAIRQALAGSDEDDDTDSWSDS